MKDKNTPRLVNHARVDFNHLEPVRGGANRSAWSPQPFYVGGRLDGQLAPAGRHPFRRSESGTPLDDDQQPPDDEHYLLFVNDGRYLLQYIHASLLPADYEHPDPEDPVSE